MVEDKPRVHVFVLQPRVSINGDCNVAYSPSGSADLTRRFMKTTVYGFQHRYDSPSIPGGSVDDVQAHNAAPPGASVIGPSAESGRSRISVELTNNQGAFS